MSINWLDYTGPDAEISKENIYELLEDDYNEEWERTVGHVAKTMTKQLEFSEEDIYQILEEQDVDENYAAREAARGMARQLDNKNIAQLYKQARRNHNQDLEKIVNPVLKSHYLQTGETVKQLLETSNAEKKERRTSREASNNYLD